MSLQQILDNDDICKIQEKFSLVKSGENTFLGKYPLQPYAEGARGVYGGEFIASAVLAAYESLDNPSFHLHSLHSYFLNPGSPQSVCRYEVETNNQTKNYVNKTVKIVQSHTNQLVFSLTCSFTLNNSITQRKIDYAEGKTPRVPYEFGSSPGPIFDEFVHRLDDEDNGLINVTHTHDLVTTAFPRYFLMPDNEIASPIGDRKMGFFIKVNDKLPQGPKNGAIRVADLLYLTDSFYLGLITRTLGFPVSHASFNFFRVSLDHSVFLHDNDFDPTDWLYCDYRFSRMSNNRVLCLVAYYDRKGKQVASVTQEGLITIPQELWDKVKGGSYKL